MSPGNPFILCSKGQIHKAQKQCRRGLLHSCECWLLLGSSICCCGLRCGRCLTLNKKSYQQPMLTVTDLLCSEFLVQHCLVCAVYCIAG